MYAQVRWRQHARPITWKKLMRLPFTMLMQGELISCKPEGTAGRQCACCSGLRSLTFCNADNPSHLLPHLSPPLAGEGQATIVAVPAAAIALLRRITHDYLPRLAAAVAELCGDARFFDADVRCIRDAVGAHTRDADGAAGARLTASACPDGAETATAAASAGVLQTVAHAEHDATSDVDATRGLVSSGCFVFRGLESTPLEPHGDRGSAQATAEAGSEAAVADGSRMSPHAHGPAHPASATLSLSSGESKERSMSAQKLAVAEASRVLPDAGSSRCLQARRPCQQSLAAIVRDAVAALVILPYFAAFDGADRVVIVQRGAEFPTASARHGDALDFGHVEVDDVKAEAAEAAGIGGTAAPQAAGAGSHHALSTLRAATTRYGSGIAAMTVDPSQDSSMTHGTVERAAITDAAGLDAAVTRAYARFHATTVHAHADIEGGAELGHRHGNEGSSAAASAAAGSRLSATGPGATHLAAAPAAALTDALHPSPTLPLQSPSGRLSPLATTRLVSARDSSRLPLVPGSSPDHRSDNAGSGTMTAGFAGSPSPGASSSDLLSVRSAPALSQRTAGSAGSGSRLTAAGAAAANQAVDGAGSRQGHVAAAVAGSVLVSTREAARGRSNSSGSALPGSSSAGATSQRKPRSRSWLSRLFWRDRSDSPSGPVPHDSGPHVQQAVPGFDLLVPAWARSTVCSARTTGPSAVVGAAGVGKRRGNETHSARAQSEEPRGCPSSSSGRPAVMRSALTSARVVPVADVAASSASSATTVAVVSASDHAASRMSVGTPMEAAAAATNHDSGVSQCGESHAVADLPHWERALHDTALVSRRPAAVRGRRTRSEAASAEAALTPPAVVIGRLTQGSGAACGADARPLAHVSLLAFDHEALTIHAVERTKGFFSQRSSIKLQSALTHASTGSSKAQRPGLGSQRASTIGDIAGAASAATLDSAMKAAHGHSVQSFILAALQRRGLLQQVLGPAICSPVPDAMSAFLCLAAAAQATALPTAPASVADSVILNAVIASAPAAPAEWALGVSSLPRDRAVRLDIRSAVRTLCEGLPLETLELVQDSLAGSAAPAGGSAGAAGVGVSGGSQGSETAGAGSAHLGSADGANRARGNSSARSGAGTGASGASIAAASDAADAAPPPQLFALAVPAAAVAAARAAVLAELTNHLVVAGRSQATDHSSDARAASHADCWEKVASAMACPRCATDAVSQCMRAVALAVGRRPSAVHASPVPSPVQQQGEKYGAGIRATGFAAAAGMHSDSVSPPRPGESGIKAALPGTVSSQSGSRQPEFALRDADGNASIHSEQPLTQLAQLQPVASVQIVVEAVISWALSATAEALAATMPADAGHHGPGRAHSRSHTNDGSPARVRNRRASVDGVSCVSPEALPARDGTRASSSRMGTSSQSGLAAGRGMDDTAFLHAMYAAVDVSSVAGLGALTEAKKPNPSAAQHADKLGSDPTVSVANDMQRAKAAVAVVRTLCMSQARASVPAAACVQGLDGVPQRADAVAAAQAASAATGVTARSTSGGGATARSSSRSGSAFLPTRPASPRNGRPGSDRVAVPLSQLTVGSLSAVVLNAVQRPGKAALASGAPVPPTAAAASGFAAAALLFAVAADFPRLLAQSAGDAVADTCSGEGSIKDNYGLGAIFSRLPYAAALHAARDTPLVFSQALPGRSIVTATAGPLCAGNTIAQISGVSQLLAQQLLRSSAVVATLCGKAQGASSDNDVTGSEAIAGHAGTSAAGAAESHAAGNSFASAYTSLGLTQAAAPAAPAQPYDACAADAGNISGASLVLPPVKAQRAVAGTSSLALAAALLTGDGGDNDALAASPAGPVAGTLGTGSGLPSRNSSQRASPGAVLVSRLSVGETAGPKQAGGATSLPPLVFASAPAAPGTASAAASTAAAAAGMRAAASGLTSTPTSPARTLATTGTGTANGTGVSAPSSLQGSRAASPSPGLLLPPLPTSATVSAPGSPDLSSQPSLAFAAPVLSDVDSSGQAARSGTPNASLQQPPALSSPPRVHGRPPRPADGLTARGGQQSSVITASLAVLQPGIAAPASVRAREPPHAFAATGPAAPAASMHGPATAAKMVPEGVQQELGASASLPLEVLRLASAATPPRRTDSEISAQLQAAASVSAASSAVSLSGLRQQCLADMQRAWLRGQLHALQGRNDSAAHAGNVKSTVRSVERAPSRFSHGFDESLSRASGALLALAATLTASTVAAARTWSGSPAKTASFGQLGVPVVHAHANAAWQSYGSQRTGMTAVSAGTAAESCPAAQLHSFTSFACEAFVHVGRAAFDAHWRPAAPGVPVDASSDSSLHGADLQLRAAVALHGLSQALQASCAAVQAGTGVFGGSSYCCCARCEAVAEEASSSASPYDNVPLSASTLSKLLVEAAASLKSSAGPAPTSPPLAAPPLRLDRYGRRASTGSPMLTPDGDTGASGHAIARLETQLAGLSTLAYIAAEAGDASEAYHACIDELAAHFEAPAPSATAAAAATDDGAGYAGSNFGASTPALSADPDHHRSATAATASSPSAAIGLASGSRGGGGRHGGLFFASSSSSHDLNRSASGQAAGSGAGAGSGDGGLEGRRPGGGFPLDASNGSSAESARGGMHGHSSADGDPASGSAQQRQVGILTAFPVALALQLATCSLVDECLRCAGGIARIPRLQQPSADAPSVTSRPMNAAGLPVLLAGTRKLSDPHAAGISIDGLSLSRVALESVAALLAPLSEGLAAAVEDVEAAEVRSTAARRRALSKAWTPARLTGLRHCLKALLAWHRIFPLHPAAPLLPAFEVEPLRQLLLTSLGIPQRPDLTVGMLMSMACVHVLTVVASALPSTSASFSVLDFVSAVLPGLQPDGSPDTLSGGAAEAVARAAGAQSARGAMAATRGSGPERVIVLPAALSPVGLPAFARTLFIYLRPDMLSLLAGGIVRLQSTNGVSSSSGGGGGGHPFVTLDDQPSRLQAVGNAAAEPARPAWQIAMQLLAIEAAVRLCGFGNEADLVDGAAGFRSRAASQEHQQARASDVASGLGSELSPGFASVTGRNKRASLSLSSTAGAALMTASRRLSSSPLQLAQPLLAVAAAAAAAMTSPHQPQRSLDGSPPGLASLDLGRSGYGSGDASRGSTERDRERERRSSGGSTTTEPLNATVRERERDRRMSPAMAPGTTVTVGVAPPRLPDAAEAFWRKREDSRAMTSALLSAQIPAQLTRLLSLEARARESWLEREEQEDEDTRAGRPGMVLGLGGQMSSPPLMDRTMHTGVGSDSSQSGDGSSGGGNVPVQGPLSMQLRMPSMGVRPGGFGTAGAAGIGGDGAGAGSETAAATAPAPPRVAVDPRTGMPLQPVERVINFSTPRAEPGALVASGSGGSQSVAHAQSPQPSFGRNRFFLMSSSDSEAPSQTGRSDIADALAVHGSAIASSAGYHGAGAPAGSAIGLRLSPLSPIADEDGSSPTGAGASPPAFGRAAPSHGHEDGRGVIVPLVPLVPSQAGRLQGGGTLEYHASSPSRTSGATAMSTDEDSNSGSTGSMDFAIVPNNFRVQAPVTGVSMPSTVQPVGAARVVGGVLAIAMGNPTPRADADSSLQPQVGASVSTADLASSALAAAAAAASTDTSSAGGTSGLPPRDFRIRLGAPSASGHGSGPKAAAALRLPEAAPAEVSALASAANAVVTSRSTASAGSTGTMESLDYSVPVNRFGAASAGASLAIRSIDMQGTTVAESAPGTGDAAQQSADGPTSSRVASIPADAAAISAGTGSGASSSRSTARLTQDSARGGTAALAMLGASAVTARQSTAGSAASGRSDRSQGAAGSQSALVAVPKQLSDAWRGRPVALLEVQGDAEGGSVIIHTTAGAASTGRSTITPRNAIFPTSSRLAGADGSSGGSAAADGSRSPAPSAPETSFGPAPRRPVGPLWRSASMDVFMEAGQAAQAGAVVDTSGRTAVGTARRPRISGATTPRRSIVGALLPPAGAHTARISNASSTDAQSARVMAELGLSMPMPLARMGSLATPRAHTGRPLLSMPSLDASGSAASGSSGSSSSSRYPEALHRQASRDERSGPAVASTRRADLPKLQPPQLDVEQADTDLPSSLPTMTSPTITLSKPLPRSLSRMGKSLMIAVPQPLPTPAVISANQEAAPAFGSGGSPPVVGFAVGTAVISTATAAEQVPPRVGASVAHHVERPGRTGLALSLLSPGPGGKVPGLVLPMSTKKAKGTFALLRDTSATGLPGASNASTGLQSSLVSGPGQSPTFFGAGATSAPTDAAMRSSVGTAPSTPAAGLGSVRPARGSIASGPGRTTSASPSPSGALSRPSAQLRSASVPRHSAHGMFLSPTGTAGQANSSGGGALDIVRRASARGSILGAMLPPAISASASTSSIPAVAGGTGAGGASGSDGALIVSSGGGATPSIGGMSMSMTVTASATGTGISTSGVGALGVALGLEDMRGIASGFSNRALSVGRASAETAVLLGSPPALMARARPSEHWVTSFLSPARPLASVRGKFSGIAWQNDQQGTPSGSGPQAALQQHQQQAGLPVVVPISSSTNRARTGPAVRFEPISEQLSPLSLHRHDTWTAPGKAGSSSAPLLALVPEASSNNLLAAAAALGQTSPSGEGAAALQGQEPAGGETWLSTLYASTDGDASLQGVPNFSPPHGWTEIDKLPVGPGSSRAGQLKRPGAAATNGVAERNSSVAGPGTGKVPGAAAAAVATEATYLTVRSESRLYGDNNLHAVVIVTLMSCLLLPEGVGFRPELVDRLPAEALTDEDLVAAAADIGNSLHTAAGLALHEERDDGSGALYPKDSRYGCAALDVSSLSSERVRAALASFVSPGQLTSRDWDGRRLSDSALHHQGSQASARSSQRRRISAGTTSPGGLPGVPSGAFDRAGQPGSPTAGRGDSASARSRESSSTADDRSPLAGMQLQPSSPLVHVRGPGGRGGMIVKRLRGAAAAAALIHSSPSMQSLLGAGSPLAGSNSESSLSLTAQPMRYGGTRTAGSASFTASASVSASATASGNTASAIVRGGGSTLVVDGTAAGDADRAAYSPVRRLKAGTSGAQTRLAVEIAPVHIPRPMARVTMGSRQLFAAASFYGTGGSALYLLSPTGISAGVSRRSRKASDHESIAGADTAGSEKTSSSIGGNGSPTHATSVSPTAVARRRQLVAANGFNGGNVAGGGAAAAGGVGGANGRAMLRQSTSGGVTSRTSRFGELESGGRSSSACPSADAGESASQNQRSTARERHDSTGGGDRSPTASEGDSIPRTPLSAAPTALAPVPEGRVPPAVDQWAHLDRYPIYVLQCHLNHPSNLAIVNIQLRELCQQRGRPFMRFLRLLSAEFFQPAHYDLRHHIASGAYGSVVAAVAAADSPAAQMAASIHRVTIAHRMAATASAAAVVAAAEAAAAVVEAQHGGGRFSARQYSSSSAAAGEDVAFFDTSRPLPAITETSLTAKHNTLGSAAGSPVASSGSSQEAGIGLGAAAGGAATVSSGSNASEVRGTRGSAGAAGGRGGATADGFAVEPLHSPETSIVVSARSPRLGMLELLGMGMGMGMGMGVGQGSGHSARSARSPRLLLAGSGTGAALALRSALPTAMSAVATEDDARMARVATGAAFRASRAARERNRDSRSSATMAGPNRSPRLRRLTDGDQATVELQDGSGHAPAVGGGSSASSTLADALLLAGASAMPANVSTLVAGRDRSRFSTGSDVIGSVNSAHNRELSVPVSAAAAAVAHVRSSIAATLLSIPLPPLPDLSSANGQMLAGEASVAIKIISFPDDPTERCILADVLPEVAILEELTQAYITAGTAGAPLRAEDLGVQLAAQDLAQAPMTTGQTAAQSAAAAGTVPAMQLVKDLGTATGATSSWPTLPSLTRGGRTSLPPLNTPTSGTQAATGLAGSGTAESFAGSLRPMAVSLPLPLPLPLSRTGRPSLPTPTTVVAPLSAVSDAVLAGTELLAMAGIRSPSLDLLRGRDARRSLVTGNAAAAAAAANAMLQETTLTSDATALASVVTSGRPRLSTTTGGLSTAAALQLSVSAHQSLLMDAVASATARSLVDQMPGSDGDETSARMEAEVVAAAAAAATATALLTDPVQFGCPVVCLLDYGVTSTAVWLVMERCATSLRAWRIDKLAGMDLLHSAVLGASLSAPTATSSQKGDRASGAGKGGSGSSARVSASGRLQAEQLLLLLDLFSCALYRLHQLHVSGVSHYDVKCDNVMLREGYEAAVRTYMADLQEEMQAASAAETAVAGESSATGRQGSRSRSNSGSGSGSESEDEAESASLTDPGVGIASASASASDVPPSTARSAFGASARGAHGRRHAASGSDAELRGAYASGSSSAAGGGWTHRSRESLAVTSASRWLQLLPHVCFADFGESIFHPGTPATLVPLVPGRGTECIKAPELLRAARAGSRRAASTAKATSRDEEGDGRGEVGAGNGRSADKQPGAHPVDGTGAAGTAGGQQSTSGRPEEEPLSAKLARGTGASCDTWGLACLLFELVTGQFLLDSEDWARFYLTVTGDESLMPPAAAALLLALPVPPSPQVSQPGLACAEAPQMPAESGNGASSTSLLHPISEDAAEHEMATSRPVTADAASKVGLLNQPVTSQVTVPSQQDAGRAAATSAAEEAAAQLASDESRNAEEVADESGPLTFGSPAHTPHAGRSRAATRPPPLDTITVPSNEVARDGALLMPASWNPAMPSLVDLLPLITPIREATLRSSLAPHLAKRFSALLLALLVRDPQIRPDLARMQQMVWDFRAEVWTAAAGGRADGE